MGKSPSKSASVPENEDMDIQGPAQAAEVVTRPKAIVAVKRHRISGNTRVMTPTQKVLNTVEASTSTTSTLSAAHGSTFVLGESEGVITPTLGKFPGWGKKKTEKRTRLFDTEEDFSNPIPMKKAPPPTAKKTGFSRGLKAESIVAATAVGGTTMFLMRWKGIVEADLVLASDAQQKCPQVVISYYEKIVQFGKKSGSAGKKFPM